MVVLARSLGPDGYGVYALVFAIVSVLAIPAQFGLPNLVMREVAGAVAREEWAYLKGILKWSNLAALGLSAVLIAVAWVLMSMSASVPPAMKAAFKYGLWLIPLLALSNLRSGALKGFGFVVVGQLPEFIVRPLLIVVLVGVSSGFLTEGRLDPSYAMAMHVIAAIISFLIGALLLRRSKPIELRRVRTAEYRSGVWSRAALPLALFAGMQVLNMHIDVLILGLYVPDESVGVYRAAVQVAALVAFGLQVVNMVVAPQFARLHALRESALLKRVWVLSAVASIVIALPAVLVLVFAGNVVLNFVFGEAYVVAAGALTVLACGQLVNASVGSVGLLLNMTGFEGLTARTIALAAACNVLMNMILIPPYGILGAAIATAVTMGALNVVLAFFARQVVSTR